MLFVNPKRILCFTVILFGKELFTVINVTPVFDGYAVDGTTIINENDFSYHVI